MKVRTELKKNHKELYVVLKEENLLEWFEKVVKYNGSIEETLQKFIEILKYQKSKYNFVD